MEEFLAHARRAYGDLRKPDYGFFQDALATRPWEPVMARLQEFLRVEDWTDREDDVSFSYVLTTGRRSPGWLLWLSAVGPFALLVYCPADDEIVRADVVVEANPDRPSEMRVVAVLREAGVRLLSAGEIETTVDFRPMDGRFPVSLFVLVFGDTDVPWWHAA
ncbi:hypothetical protein OG439_05850 [Amycolatopsis sp. NBC_01307]|uniref:hypothetical protein n=1 Tax=Amycolatopsis sp. NBC_01307 TaxID=2903561 RepID=UPI002E1094BB|nr:hypothetical protein OG439_05850 [Amycolatopsis sp. NBC_01307]